MRQDEIVTPILWVFRAETREGTTFGADMRERDQSVKHHLTYEGANRGAQWPCMESECIFYEAGKQPSHVTAYNEYATGLLLASDISAKTAW